MQGEEGNASNSTSVDTSTEELGNIENNTTAPTSKNWDNMGAEDENSTHTVTGRMRLTSKLHEAATVPTTVPETPQPGATPSALSEPLATTERLNDAGIPPSPTTVLGAEKIVNGGPRRIVSSSKTQGIVSSLNKKKLAKLGINQGRNLVINDHPPHGLRSR